MPSPPLVLVTGGNGFVGYAVLVGTLNAGYHVRAAVRRQEAVDTISRGPSIQKFLSRRALTFAIVPDNTQTGAYLEAVKDCSYFIHVASPVPATPGDPVSSALAGTKAVLEAAQATPSMKRVVFTASSASLKPFERVLADHPSNQAIMSGRDDDVPVIKAESRVMPSSPSTSDDAPPLQRYYNSKSAATNYVDDFAKTHDPHFSIVNLMPAWVLGPAELARNKAEAFQGSNGVLGWLFSDVSLAPHYGLAEGEEAPWLAAVVHVEDVVESHVKALDVEKVPGSYRNFLLCSHTPKGPVMMDAVDIVRGELADEVADGKIPFTGKMGTIEFKFDATPAERELLGHPFRSFDEQVKDTIRWYIQLDD